MHNRYDKIKTYYSGNTINHNDEAGILGWESHEAQIKRFDAFINNLNIQHSKLLDVGCGLGNLLEYLDKKSIIVEYTGIDILPMMIEGCLNKGLRGRFILLDIFQNNPFTISEFDTVFTSGIFNLDLGNNERFIKEAFELFHKLATKNISFNLLHKKSPDKETGYFYYCPDKAVKMIESTGLDFKKIEIVENYLDNDFTVIVSK